MRVLRHIGILAPWADSLTGRECLYNDDRFSTSRDPP